MELYLKNKGGDNKLVSYKEWKRIINNIKRNVKGITKITEEEAAERLKELIIESVRKRTNEINDLENEDKTDIYVLFSGGIDSTIIALALKSLNVKFKCISVGTKKSKDLIMAEKIAREYNFNIEKKVLSSEEILENLEAVMRILKTSNKMKLGVGTVLYSALKFITIGNDQNKENKGKKKGKEKENKEEKTGKTRIVMTGLGTEDIFAGYNKHLIAMMNKEDINELCWHGLITTYERDLTRDIPIIKSFKEFNVVGATPFLDEKIIRFGMGLKPELKIRKIKYKDESGVIKEGFIKKYILRISAVKLGLKKEFAMRPKRAAQYGSGIEKEIIKLAKKEGFKKEIEWLRNKLQFILKSEQGNKSNNGH